MTLEEALALGFRITEVDAAGSVPELIAFNPLDTPVLLYDGEELLGAKQNRILNVTVLVAPKSETKIPVSCVEQGRRHARSARLKTKTPRQQAGLFEERMMGLEPTTFCMASARDVRTRSGAFAETACLQRLRRSERTDANPERTPNLAILATRSSVRHLFRPGRLGVHPDRLRRFRTTHTVFEESLRERVRSDRPDPVDLGPLVRSGCEEPLDAPEPLEQRLRGRIGDTRNTAEHVKPGTRELATRLRRRPTSPPFLADSEPMQPLSRIGRISGVDDSNS